MSTRVVTEALAGRSVLISETGIEPLQFVGRAGATTFLAGGRRQVDGEAPSGMNPYEMLAAALGTCTAMTIRLYADREDLALTRLQVAVTFLRGAGARKNVFERRIFLDGFLSEANKAILIQIAAQCPVGRILGTNADMKTFVEFSPEAWPQTLPEEPALSPAEAWWEDELRTNADFD